MAKVKKLDSKRRVIFPDLFVAGDVFVESKVTDRQVTFTLVHSERVSEVMAQMDGDWPVFEKSLTKDEIRKAVREERDSR